MLAILRAIPGESVVHFGMVCSSWVTICRASTERSFFVPLGSPLRDGVRLGNLLVSRRGNCMIGFLCTVSAYNPSSQNGPVHLLMRRSEIGVDSGAT